MLGYSVLVVVQGACWRKLFVFIVALVVGGDFVRGWFCVRRWFVSIGRWFVCVGGCFVCGRFVGVRRRLVGGGRCFVSRWFLVRGRLVLSRGPS